MRSRRLTVSAGIGTESARRSARRVGMTMTGGGGAPAHETNAMRIVGVGTALNALLAMRMMGTTAEVIVVNTLRRGTVMAMNSVVATTCTR